jgi:hypothetical protein
MPRNAMALTNKLEYASPKVCFSLPSMLSTKFLDGFYDLRILKVVPREYLVTLTRDSHASRGLVT